MKSYNILFTLGLLLSASPACLASSSSSAIDAEKEAKKQAAFQRSYVLEKENVLRKEQRAKPVDIALAGISFLSFIQKSEMDGAKFDETDLHTFLKDHAANQKIAIFLGNRLFKQGKIEEGKEILSALPRGILLIAEAYKEMGDIQNANATYFNAVRSFQETEPIAGQDHPRLHYANFLWRHHSANEALEQYNTLMAENILYTTYAFMGMFSMNIYRKEYYLAMVDFHGFLNVLETVTANNMTLLCRLFEHNPNNEGWMASLYELLQKDKVPFKVVEIFEAKIGRLKHTILFTGFAEVNITRKAEPLSCRIHCATPRHVPIREEYKKFLLGKNIYK